MYYSKYRNEKITVREYAVEGGKILSLGAALYLITVLAFCL